MIRIWIVGLALAAPVTSVGIASAAIPTTLTVTAPPTVGLGEEITVEATLRAAGGLPLAGAPLTLFQAGVVGERKIAQATTNEQGRAAFVHSEFSVFHLSLRVRYAGTGQYAPAMGQTDVEISGLEVPPAVVMSHTPSPLVKTVLFSILGAVWLTYAFAGSCIVRIIRGDEARGVRAGIGR